MDLQLFLESNVPKSKKSKQTVLLGVSEESLATRITNTLGIACSTSGTVFEIIRGKRTAWNTFCFNDFFTQKFCSIKIFKFFLNVLNNLCTWSYF